MAVYFHVTLDVQMHGIEARGVLAEMSRGARDVSWWVGKARIEWAILHVANKYKVRIDEVWVCAAEIEGKELKRTSLGDVYYTAKESIKICAATPAPTLIENEAQLQEWVALTEIPF